MPISSLTPISGHEQKLDRRIKSQAICEFSKRKRVVNLKTSRVSKAVCAVFLGLIVPTYGYSETECEYDSNAEWPQPANKVCQSTSPQPATERNDALFLFDGVAHPFCSSSRFDPDGDGWGWENSASCKVADSNPSETTTGSSNTTSVEGAYCSSAESDPDGDGWGWENNSSCKVNPDTSGTTDSSIDLKESISSAVADSLGSTAPEAKAGDPVIFELGFENSGSGIYSPDQLNEDWAYPVWHLGLNENRASIVDESGRGKVLQVTYPGGAYGSAGAVAFMTDLDFSGQAQSYDELYLSYEVKFSKGFEFVRGGKLPGLCGYNNTQTVGSGCNTGGGYPTGYDGWSARVMWREGGALENYMYHSKQTHFYGDDEYWQKLATPGSWHHFQHRVVMNDPGVANGIMQAWLDGELVLDMHDVEYRKTADIGINLFYFSTFYGGNDSSWAPSKDQMTYFDNFKISTRPLPTPVGKALAANDAQSEGAFADSPSGGNGGGSFSLWMLLLGGFARRRYRSVLR